MSKSQTPNVAKQKRLRRQHRALRKGKVAKELNALRAAMAPAMQQASAPLPARAP